MADYRQKGRVLSFKSPLGVDKLLAHRFRGAESISELFSYEALLLAEPTLVVNPAALVGKRVTMTMEVGGSPGKQRHFNGVVASLESDGGDELFHKYRVRMVPAMWIMSLHKQTRVFQDKSVLDIVRKVFQPYSIMPRVETQSTYTALEYCTQYRETDLEFVERLLDRHGIFYYFDHSESDHTLVLSDKSSHCSDCQFSSDLDFQTNTEETLDFYKPLVYDFRCCSTLISGEHTSWDYRFMKYANSYASPRTSRSSEEMGNNQHELYDYSDSAVAHFKTEGAEPKAAALQTQLQKVGRDSIDAQAVQCAGKSTANTMQAGFTFSLRKYPQAESNTKYLLTRVEHNISQCPPYRAQDVPAGAPPYRNYFEARPFKQIFRKSPSKSKPRVNGVITGKVVTMPGEDSHLDRFGRVCVQFWWDRDRTSSTPDKTLLRVAQQWAGKGWGTYFWPRTGDEVLIDFIEGDPDAPIVVGSVYNGINLPKYDPKSQYTRSGILTRSSRNGFAANANELRFDDRKGSEQIFMNAERDLDLHVENDWHTRVDNQEHRHVKDSQYHRVGGDAQLSISGSQRVHVSRDRGISVDGIQTETFATILSTQVGEAQFNKTGGVHLIEAGGAVQLQAGGVMILQANGLLYLVVNGVGLAITAAGLAILAALGVGEIGPPPVIPPPVIPPSFPCHDPTWPGDD